MMKMGIMLAAIVLGVLLPSTSAIPGCPSFVGQTEEAVSTAVFLKDYRKVKDTFGKMLEEGQCLPSEKYLTDFVTSLTTQFLTPNFTQFTVPLDTLPIDLKLGRRLPVTNPATNATELLSLTYVAAGGVAGAVLKLTQNQALAGQAQGKVAAYVGAVSGDCTMTYAQALVDADIANDIASCVGILKDSTAENAREALDAATKICEAPVHEVVADMCSLPEFCPDSEDTIDFQSLVPVYECISKDFEDNSPEKEDYVNSGGDIKCVQTVSTNACDTKSVNEILGFAKCTLRTKFIVNAFVGGGESKCEEKMWPKPERCELPFGELVTQFCTESNFLEENFYVILGGGIGGGIVLIGIITFIICRYQCTCCQRRDGSLMGKSVGPKHTSLNSYTSAFQQQQHMPSMASSYTSPPMIGAYPSPGNSASQLSMKSSFAPVPGQTALKPSNKYHGVMFNPTLGVWVAEIRANGVNEYLGQFDTEEEAGRAYDIRALQVNGDVAELNFPFGVPTGSSSAKQIGSPMPGTNGRTGGGSFAGMPPPVPSRNQYTPASTAGSASRDAISTDNASLKAQLIQFYNFHDPSRPDIPGHVDKLFQKYNFSNIARAVKAKYQRLPPGWDEELEKREAGSKQNKFGPPPGL